MSCIVMEIILNERNKAAEILKTKEIGKNTTQCLSVLAKYFYSPVISDFELYEILNDFMNKNFKGYNSDNWKSCIEYQIKLAKKHKLIEIEYIPVTENELRTIKSLNNKRLERLSFTILIVAKYYNEISESNNNWVNREFKSLFTMANIAASQDIQCDMIFKLKNLNMIGLSKKIDSLNLNVKYIDEESSEILKITDMRNLGNQYRLYCKDKGYKKCKCCERVIKIKKNQMYCKDCSCVVNRKNQREWSLKHKEKIEPNF